MALPSPPPPPGGKAKPKDGIFRILSNLNAVQEAVREGYANTTANLNAYLDISVYETPACLKTTFKPNIVCKCAVAGCDHSIGSYSKDHTAYHIGASGKDHPKNSYQAMGVKKQEGFFGDAGFKPHTYLPVWFIKAASTRTIVGVKPGTSADGPFVILSNDTMTIRVADERGENEAQQQIKFDAATFADGEATAAEVVSEINADKGALPITASVVTIPLPRNPTSVDRVCIDLNVGSEDKTIRVEIGGVDDVCGTLGFECDFVMNDNRQVKRTLIHELGHLILPLDGGVSQFDGKLDVHTPATHCAFYQTANDSSFRICPKHVVAVRQCVSRSWPEHDSVNKPTAAQIVNDSGVNN